MTCWELSVYSFPMKLGKDISAHFKDLYIVHQNIPGKQAKISGYNQHILFIPLQGEITIQTSKREFIFGPGRMLYLPPQLQHSFTSSRQSGERLIAMLEAKSMGTMSNDGMSLVINQLIKEILFYLLLHPKTKNSQSLVSVFSETLSEVLEKSPLSELEHLEGRVQDLRIRQALELMRASISAPMSLDNIAKKAGLSVRNLNRLFIKETGLQPRQWLINFRVDRAQNLLKKPGATVTEVALEVGYNSLSQFISAFRSRTGQLPSEYLKRG